MTSFVASASTMFGRLPGRHSSKQKDPVIGSPVLVDSSRADILLLSSTTDKNLPPLPDLRNTSRYTTTPNFESSPIMPSQAIPPAFYQIQPPILPEEPQPKRNMFARKASTTMSTSTNKTPKSLDLLEAAKQKQSIDLSRLTGPLSPRRAKSQKFEIPKASAYAPRLRDSIVPTMVPIIDKSFFGGLEDDSDKENMDVPSLTPSKHLSPNVTPRLRLATSENDIYTRARLSRTSSEDSRGPYTPSSATIQISIAPDIVFGKRSELNMARHSDRFKAPVPTPTEADEHIADLESRRDKLTNKQRDVLQRIQDIQSILPPNPSTHDRRQREALKEELRDMQALYDSLGKELHETGMMLHRAWRRRDVKLGLEAPAVLWVRRVNT